MPDCIDFDTLHFHGYAKLTSWRLILKSRYKIGERIHFRLIICPKNNKKKKWKNWYLVERYPIKRIVYPYDQILDIPEIKNWNGKDKIKIEVVGKRILQLPGIYSFSIGRMHNNVLCDEEVFFSTEVISKDEIRVRIRAVFFTTFGLVLINAFLGAYGLSLEDVCRFILNLFLK